MPHFLSEIVESHNGPVQLIDAVRGTTLADRVECAFDSASRKRGLLGRASFADGSAVIIAPCNAVHTFFMKFPIDVAFVDRGGSVMKVVAGLRPWRMAACPKAFAAIELPAEAGSRHALRAGDRVAVAVGSDANSRDSATTNPQMEDFHLA